MTALFASPPKNGPPADRFHARTEPVFILTLAVAWLVCSFHIIGTEKAGENTHRAPKTQKRKEGHKSA
ncbi:uncharacterized protein METZ01_LOCUS172449 [marine metagenome]|jgi:hypothetical protein|uniref:Uncharacterized protein n=1 Tax=marine metagenome TaxID=408172 RepID=A0A382C0I0_9ZZZZ